jgi:hypothetical protein
MGSARAEPIYSVGPTRGRRKTHLKKPLKKNPLKNVRATALMAIDNARIGGIFDCSLFRFRFPLLAVCEEERSNIPD